jgi:hypothetical protein
MVVPGLRRCGSRGEAAGDRRHTRLAAELAPSAGVGCATRGIAATRARGVGGAHAPRSQSTLAGASREQAASTGPHCDRAGELLALRVAAPRRNTGMRDLDTDPVSVGLRRTGATARAPPTGEFGVKRSELIAAMRKTSVLVAAVALGLKTQAPRNASGGSILGCPACNADRRHPSRRDRRGAIGVRHDGRGWQCFECEATGDAST